MYVIVVIMNGFGFIIDGGFNHGECHTKLELMTQQPGIIYRCEAIL